MHFDIAIIGYGPVGAVAANMFGASGHNVVVVEPKKIYGIYLELLLLMGKLKEFFSQWALLMISPELHSKDLNL